ncbi:hypothetical protein L0F63_005201 [Massospora cicadina]|nr:hypothetical protein L0F63_005201 [Massospora cicadina]
MNFYFLLVASLQLVRRLVINFVARSVEPRWLIILLDPHPPRDDLDPAINNLHHLGDSGGGGRLPIGIGDGSLRQIRSRDIQVGDLICLDEEDEIPCDLVLISTLHVSAEALINTSNLDGESNLKTLIAPAGAILKLPARAVGIAVYTGAQTKLGNNKQPATLKLTVLDRQIERVSLLVFSFQLVLVLLLGAVGNHFRRYTLVRHTYLMLREDLGSRRRLLEDMVSLDLVKFLCSQFVGWDLNLLDEAGGPADVANTAVADDLGQIEILFTDKTGTLTENLMVYSGCSIQGRRYAPDAPAPLSDAAARFYQVLSLCHSVQPVESTRAYQGSSPDEEALVGAACRAGYRFLGEVEGVLRVESQDGIHCYRLLHKLEFSSSRKMSVVVQELNGPILLLTKGADDTLLPVCRASPIDAKTRSHLADYAALGLRTLAVGSRVVPEEEYLTWRAHQLAAETSLQREQALEASAIELEVDLELLGCTAIEDRLQPAVPETVESIRRAGVKVWMLTGDKLDTALQIGRSCCLLPSQGRCLVLSSEKLSPGCLLRCMAHELSLESGASLVALRASFVQLSLQAPAVVCCRTTPKQKGDLVQAIKDCGSMIQQANIGIGIRGREGLQAARAADLSLSRFHHLRRLMLVHGRYSLHRVRFVALYCFYKSIVVTMIQGGYQALAGFSGTSLLTEYALTLYNVAYTGLPILMYSVDKDISEEHLLATPSLYQHAPGRDPHYLLLSGTFRWLSWAIVQGLLILVLAVVLDLEGGLGTFALGTPGAGLGLSYMAYSAVVVTVQLTLAFATNHFTWLNHAAIWGGVSVYFATTQGSAYLFSALRMEDIVPLVKRLSFWASLSVTIITLAFPTYLSVYLQYRPPASNLSRLARLSTVLRSGGSPSIPPWMRLRARFFRTRRAEPSVVFIGQAFHPLHPPPYDRPYPSIVPSRLIYLNTFNIFIVCPLPLCIFIRGK